MSSTLSGHIQESPLPSNRCRVFLLQLCSRALQDLKQNSQRNIAITRKTNLASRCRFNLHSLFSFLFIFSFCIQPYLTLSSNLFINTRRCKWKRLTWAVLASFLRCSRNVLTNHTGRIDTHLGLLEGMSVWLLWISPPHAGQLCPKPVPVLQKVSNTVTYTPKGTENTTELEHPQVLTKHGRHFGQMTCDSRSWFAFSKSR